MKLNPLYAIAVLLALVLVAFLLLCQPSKAQEPDPIQPVYETYLPGVFSYTYPFETFRKVGSVADFAGFNGISGRAVVAGLQTLIIVGLSMSQPTDAEIWLCKWPDLETPVWVVASMQERIYSNEWIQVQIPWWLWYGSADYVVIYGTGKYTGVLAAGQFIEPNWWEE